MQIVNILYFKISQIDSFIPPLLKINFQAVAYVTILSDYGASLTEGLASFLFFRYLGRAPIDEGILYDAGPGSFVDSRFLFLRDLVNATKGPSFFGSLTNFCLCFLPYKS